MLTQMQLLTHITPTILATLMRTLTKQSIQIIDEQQKLKTTVSYDLPQASFFQEVIESLQDGILILTETGKLVYTNTRACQICHQLNKDGADINCVPPAIWNLCKSLRESTKLFPNQMIMRLFPDQRLVMSDEIVCEQSTIFRIRVRWLDSEHVGYPCFIVTIENRFDTLKNVVIAEVKKYHMTPREGEIWSLYRANYTYKDIAAQLHITLNTVKKHMKNIHAKRQRFVEH
jgi:DNA-binding CsgD family transcriptional regulator